jgi:YD repeat-containing protein
MVAIVSGNGIGLLNTSGKTLGQNGLFGNAAVGSSKERAYVNVANGNLVLQDQDDYLAATGVDLALARTYNSQGSGNDGLGTQWKLGVAKQIVDVTATTLTRIDGDGTAQLYTLDGNGAWVSTDGSGAYQTIRQTADGWIWCGDHKDQRGLTEVYDSNGRIASVNDDNGVRLRYQYDASGHVQQIVDASGDITHFDFDAAGNLAQIRTRTADATSDFVRVSYGYDASHRLVTTTVDLTPADNTDARSYTTTYGYDGTSNRIATLTQSDGTSLSFTYIAAGATYKVSQMTALVDGKSRITKYSYWQGLTTVTDPLLNSTLYSYDAAGRLTSVSKPSISGPRTVTSYAYDTSGNVTQVTEPSGQVTTAEYDANGNQTKITDAVGNVTVRQFDPANNLLLNETVQNDAAGAAPQTTLYAYDAAHRVRFVVSPEGRVTEYRYNNEGQRTNAIQYTLSRYDMRAATSATTVDEVTMAAWVGTAKRASVIQTVYSYDARGLLYTEATYAAADANGNPVSPAATTVYFYDQSGQLLSTLGPKGNATYSYDGLGRLLSATDAARNTTVNSYDDAGNTLSTTAANGMTTISAYDAAGELVSVTQTDANGVVLGVSRYTYDADGRLVMAVDPDGVHTFRMYDIVGRLAATVDGDGTMTEYFYDASDNLTRTRQYATRIATSTLLGANGVWGNRTPSSVRPAVSANDRSTWNIYDTLGRLVDSVDGEGHLVHREYALGQLVKVTARANLVNVATIAYVNVPTAFSVGASPDDRVTRSFYDEDGKLLATLDGEGALVENRYDGAGQLVETIDYAAKSTNTDGATLADVRPAASAGDVRQRYIHDGRGRLVGTVDGKGILTETVYSDAGNVTRTKTYGTAIGTAFADDATIDALRPASSSADDRQVDYVYDALNRLEREIASTGTVTTYAYDNMGNMVAKSVGLANDPQSGTQYRYDAHGHVTAQLPPLGIVALNQAATPAAIDAVWRDYATTYTYDAAGLRTSMTEPGGARTLYYYDADGRLAYTVDALGQVAMTAYSAFGQVERTVQYAKTIDAATLAGMTGGLASAAGTTFTALASTNDSAQTYVYDRDGRQTDHVDALNYHTVTKYDAFGEVAGTFQPGAVNTTAVNAATDGFARSFYDKAGNLAMSVTGAGGVTVYQYDGNGRVVDKVTYANVVTTNNPLMATLADISAAIVPDPAHDYHQHYAYDARGQLAATFTATELVDGMQAWSLERRAYDASGNLVERRTSANAIVPQALTLDSALTFPFDDNDQVVRYYYDGQNRLTATASALRGGAAGPDWAVSTQAYDAVGNIVAKTTFAAAFRHAAPTAADIQSFVATGASPTDQVTRYAYDRANQLVATAVAQGMKNGALAWSVTRNDYDDKTGRLLAQTQLATQLSSATLPSSKTPADYDTWLRAGAAAHSAQDRTTRYGYDALGRVTTTIDPAGSVTQRVFDTKGNVARTIAYATPDTGTGTIGADYAPATSDADRVVRTVYDKDNRAVFRIDAMGNLTAYAYDARGLLTKTTEYWTPLDVATLPDFPLPSDVKPSAAGGVRVTRRSYDQAGRLRFSGDGAGYATETRYDGVGRVSKSIAWDSTIFSTDTAPTAGYGASRTTAYVYDAQGNLTSTVDADDVAEYSSYDGAGNRISFTNKAGATWTYRYDAAGRMVQENSPQVTAYANAPFTGQAGTSWESTHAPVTASVVTRIVYDVFGNVASRTDAAGTAQERTTRYVYDAAGRQVQTILPSTMVYDPTSIPSNGPLSSLMPAGSTNHDRYEKPSGELTVNVTYDAFGDAIANKDVGGNVSEKAYDANGQVAFERDALNYLTEYQRDAFGNVTGMIRHALTYTGSMTGGLQQIRNAIGAGAATDRAIVTQYDLAGRQVKTIEPMAWIYDPSVSTDGPILAAHTVETEYNGFGDVLSRSSYGADADGNKVTAAATTRYYYDARGNKRAELALLREPDAGVIGLGYLTTYTYTAAGQVAAKTEYATASTMYGTTADTTTYAIPNQADQDRKTTYTYDKLGNVLSESHNTYTSQVVNGIRVWSDANLAKTTFTYDVLGNKTSAVDALGGAVYTQYDVLGRVTAVKKAQTADVAGITTAGSPLTEFKLDVYGNVVLRIDYAQGAADNTATNFAALAPDDAENHKTATAYDLAGHAIEVTTGVEGAESGTFAPHMTFTSYDVFGRAVRQWTPYTDNDAAQTQRVAYKVTNYDKLGRVASELTPANVNNVDNADTHRIHYTTMYRYDAFGELISRDMSDGGSAIRNLEKTSFDNAGHAWRTSAGDGVTKVVLFDAQGNATSTIRSGDASGASPLDGLASVERVFSLNNLLRTDTSYDLLGHALSVTNVGDLTVMRYVREGVGLDHAAGTWTEVADTFQPDDLVVVARPDDSAKTISVSYRLVGDTAWTVAPDDRIQTVNGYRAFAAAGLPTGRYEFQVTTKGGNEMAFVSARGTLDITATTSQKKDQDVIRLYTVVLNRAPTQAELNRSVARMNNGVRLVQLAQELLATDEAKAYLGSTGDSAVATIFANGFGRPGPAGDAFYNDDEGIYAWRFGQTAPVNGDSPAQTVIDLIEQTLAPRSTDAPRLAGKTWLENRVAVLAAYMVDNQGADPATAARLLAAADAASKAGASIDPLKTDAAASAVMDRQRLHLAQLYVSLFGRAPDPAGMAAWLGAVQGDEARIEAAAQSIFESAEAKTDPQLYPSASLTDDQYLTQLVTHVYRNMVDRLPTAGELATWVGALDGSNGQPPLAKGVFLMRLADSIAGYDGADPARLQDKQLYNNRVGVALAIAGLKDANGNPLAIDVAASKLIVSTVGADPSTAAAAAAAIDALGKKNASAGPIGDAASALAASTQVEAARFQIARLYTALLGRAPDAIGMAYFMANPPTTPDGWAALANALMTSSEARADGNLAAYKTVNGTLVPRTDAEFVQRMYELATGQSPLPAGVVTTAEIGAFTQRLANGESRGSIAVAIVNGMFGGVGMTLAEQALKDQFDNRAALGVAFAVDLGANDLQLARDAIAKVTATDMRTALDFAYAASQSAIAAAFGGNGTDATAVSAALDAEVQALRDKEATTTNAATAANALSGTANAADLLSLVQVYVALIGRTPSNDELKAAFGALNDKPLAQVVQDLYDSAEMSGAGGRYPSTMTDAVFLNQVYANVLSVKVDSPLPYWAWPNGTNFMQQLQAGVPRGQVWFNVLNDIVNFATGDGTFFVQQFIGLRAALLQRVATALQTVDNAANAEYGPIKADDNALHYKETSLTNSLASAISARDLYMGTANSLMANVDKAGDGLATYRLKVMMLYATLLQRTNAPTLAELASWTDANVPIDQVAQGMMTGEEAGTTYTSLDDTAFVGLIYQRVLHRDLQPADGTYWVDRLAAGATRGQVVVEILDNFNNYNETSYAQLTAKYRFDAAVAGMLLTEYAWANSANSTASYAYSAARQATSTAKASYDNAVKARDAALTAMNTAVTNAGYARTIQANASRQYDISYIYMGLRGSTDIPGLANWMASNDTDAMITQLLPLAGSANNTFVSYLYKRVTGVYISSADLNLYTGQLNNGTATRLSVAKTFLYSSAGQAYLAPLTNTAVSKDTATVDGYIANEPVAIQTYEDDAAAVDPKYQAWVTAQANEAAASAASAKALNAFRSLQSLQGAFGPVVSADNYYASVVKTQDDLAANEAAMAILDAQVAVLKPYAAADDAALIAGKADSGLAKADASMANAIYQDTALSANAREVHQVAQLYTALIGTQPTPPALKYWADQLAAGASRVDVIAGIMNGPEAVAAKLYPDTLTDDAFVIQLYRLALGRTVAANQAEPRSWSDQLAGENALTRPQLVDKWIDSVMQRGNTDTINFDQRVSPMLDQIAATATTVTNATKTAPAYVNIASYAAAYASLLGDAAGRAAVAANPQAAIVNRVARLYMAIFDRTPDADGLVYWVNAMASQPKVTDADFAQSMLASAEALALYPSTMSTTAFAATILGRVLGRTASAAELAGYAYGRGYAVARILTAAAAASVNLEQQESTLLFNDKVAAAIATLPSDMAAYVVTSAHAIDLAGLAQAAKPADTHVEPVVASVDSHVDGGKLTLTATTYKMDRWGNVLTMTDPRDANWVTTYTYNGNNQLLSTRAPNSLLNDTVRDYATTSTTYDLLGRVLTTTDGNSHVNRRAYDSNGNVLTETHADGGVVSSAYDLFGQRLTVTQPGATSTTTGVMTSYAYDHFGNLKMVDTGIDAPSYHVENVESGTPDLSVALNGTDGVVVRYDYDELGRRIRSEDGTHSVTRWQYDVSGNLVAQTDAMNHTSYSTFDALGHMVKQVDAIGTHRQTWIIGNHGQVIGHMDLEQSGGVWNTALYVNYTYDAAGRLRTQTSGGGQSLTYTYVGAELRKIEDKGTHQVTNYAYDRAGNRTLEQTVHTAAVDGIVPGREQNNVLTYDVRNRLSGVDDGAYKLAYSYDGNGNRTKTHTEYDTTAADGTTQHVTYDTYNTYDRMNRQLIVNGTLSGSTVVLGVVRDLKTSQDLGVIGHQLTYDLAGNRLSDTYRGAKLTYANGVWNATTAATDTTTETYGYDGAGRLATVTRDGIRIDTRYYDAAGRVLVSGMAAQDVTSDQSLLTIGDRGAFDAAIKTAGITSQFQIFAYDPAGHVMRQVTRNIDRGLQGDVYLVSDEWNPTAGYDADGNLTGYTAIDMSHGQKIKYTISYNFRDGAAQETNTTVVSDGGQKSTTSDYDVNGNRYIIHNGNTGVDTHLFYDTSGHVLQKVDGTVETFSLIVNDQVLGVEDKQANNVMGMTYTSLSSQAPTDAPSIYTVQADTETLQTIAKSLWGDGSLWYVIADANGMTAPGPLQVGQTLRVPTRVTTVHNTSDTFKPYSASDAIGDVTPLPVPSNSHGGCGTIGTIIAVVIAAVVTVYTAGAAAGWLAGAAPSVFGATAAGAAAAGAAAVPNALALAVGGAIGGAAGSAASQSFSIAAGLQSGFDWHGVARSAIGGAVSGAVNGAKLFDGMDETWQTAAARAAVSSTISQGINIATGLQHGFDWRAVATSSAGAGVGAQVDGTKLPFGGFGNAVASRFAGGMTTSLLSGGKVDVAMVAADAFGNVLGNSLAENTQSTPAAPKKSFSDSIDRGPDWLQKWKAEPSALSGFSNEELDNYMRTAIDDGQIIAGDKAGSAGGKGIRGIIPFSQASGLPANTVSSVDGMPSNRQYIIAANFEVRDDGTINKVPAYYTALNTLTNQIDYVIGQTDLPKFMSDPFGSRVKAWANNQPAYGRDASDALINLTSGAMNGDDAQVRQGAGQLAQSWSEALASPDYLVATALSWTGGVIAKESIMQGNLQALRTQYGVNEANLQVEATFQHNGSMYYDVNQTARNPALANETRLPIYSESKATAGAPNQTFASAHAEIGAMGQSFIDGNLGGNATLTIYGKDACTFCVSDVKKMALQLKLDSLTVVQPSGTVKFTNPIDFAPVKKGGLKW